MPETNPIRTAIDLVQLFGIANTYPDFSHDEAIEMLDMAIEEEAKNMRIPAHEAVRNVFDRIAVQTPRFVIFPDDPGYTRPATGIVYGNSLLVSPVDKKLRRTSRRADDECWPYPIGFD